MKSSVIAAIAFAIVMASLASQAAAQNELCIGKPTQYMMQITNTGAKDDTYAITPSDMSWVQVQDSVFIKAGETEDLTVTVTPQHAGPNPFYLTVTSSQESKVLNGKAYAKECRGVSISASPTQVEACDNTPAQYDIIIKNTGQTEDSFQLAASKGSLEKSDVTIEPGQSATVRLTVQAKGLGSESIVITASSGPVSESQIVELYVKSCYKADLKIIPKEKSICPCSSVTFQVRLSNTGEIADEYDLSIEGITQTVQMAPGESRLFDFSIPLLYGHGSRVIKASAESSHITLEDTATLTVKPAAECYSVEVAGASKLTVEKCTAQTVPIKIKNTGDVTQIYTISTDGPEWAYLSRADAYVGAGEEKEVFLYLSPTYDVAAGEYKIMINATSQNSMNALEVSVKVVPNATETAAQPVQPVQPNATAGPGESEINVSFGGNTSEMTGGVIALGAAPFWKMVIVTAITLVIIVILVARFTIFVKR